MLKRCSLMQNTSTKQMVTKQVKQYYNRHVPSVLWEHRSRRTQLSFMWEKWRETWTASGDSVTGAWIRVGISSELKGKERCSRSGNDQTLSLLQDSNPLGGDGASDGTLKKIVFLKLQLCFVSLLIKCVENQSILR